MSLTNFNPLELETIEEHHQAINMLLDLISNLQQESIELKAERQRLRDEYNHLQREQGKPSIKSNKKTSPDHSSEKKRAKQRLRKPKRKKRHPHAKVKIDREVILSIPPEQLPADAILKGYEEVVVQDIILKTNLSD